ncbi:MauE/DoxX family redox-associated membrane protein [Priestia sp. LL-8]|uniref:MauE/DoxX family redox-associated membrane protein n=1 Tax=Priestia sp. LL-8 TaxID=3110068 RepID=UPI0015F58AE5|nr:MauE/DoxX family redox-associated membrane protein [Priestia sp. LL-8]MED5247480.1 MauE/DoxX family redox-associated membrane protein [Priestia sp. LL-8]
MESILLVIRFVVFIIFFSSGIEKIKEIKKHEGAVSDFKVLPSKIVPLFSRMDPILEIVISVGILLGFFLKINIFLCLILLLIYNIAIVINLLRGRYEISCGCGGVVGTHNLSWWLVTRNTLIMASLILLLTRDSVLFSIDALLRGSKANLVLFNPLGYLIILSTTITIIVLKIIINIKLIFKRMKYMYERKL